MHIAYTIHTLTIYMHEQRHACNFNSSKDKGTGSEDTHDEKTTLDNTLYTPVPLML